jgi:GT2 family glycosyltransferase
VIPQVLINPSKKYPEILDTIAGGLDSPIIVFDENAQWIAEQSDARWIYGRTDRIFLKYWDTRKFSLLELVSEISKFVKYFDIYIDSSSRHEDSIQRVYGASTQISILNYNSLVFKTDNAKNEKNSSFLNDVPKLGILLVHIDAYDVTQECLSSIRNTTYSHKQVYVLDNSSQNLSGLLLFLTHSEVIMLFATSRTSYCESFNILADFATRDQSQYLFVSNNDTRGHSSDIFEQLISDISIEIGMVSPVIYDYHHELLRSESVSHFGVDFSLATEAYVIDANLWAKLGGFTNDFNIYCEDVDLLLRLRFLEIDGAYNAHVELEHLQNATTKTKVFLKTYFYIRNVIWIQKRKRVNCFKNFLYFTTQESLSLLKQSFSQSHLRDMYPALVTPFYLFAGIFSGIFTNPQENKSTDLSRALLRTRWELKYKVR